MPTKVNVVLDDDVKHDLDQLVDSGMRSRVVNRALRREILAIRRERANRRLEELRKATKPATTAALVGQILELKVEGARLALLARDGLAFKELTLAARGWLAQHYDLQDADVQFALRELDRLGAQSLAPAPPDISRSLTLLRAHLGAIVR